MTEKLFTPLALGPIVLRHDLSNPGLPRRIELGAPLTPYHRPTFYGGGAAGYTDHPSLDPKAECGG